MNDIPTFTLYSNELGGNATLEQVAKECGGENVSPQLSWINAPKGTKSFAITIHDKDAPTGGGFWHWIIFNIPPKIQTIPSGAGDPTKNLIPFGSAQSKNDYGYYGYGGPCPPVGTGDHQYLITIFALDIDKLDADKDTLANEIGFNLWSHTIKKASIVLYYRR
ncbi:MAG: YbhB/YbcL family Raf kinase inhibitor-like protein [Bacteroidales bacterium]|nr:YbhB/YbcL family Raf kinase inhibitor-like protein [Bacteroidales bacterium]